MYSDVTSLASVRLDVNHDPNPPRQPIQDQEQMKKVIGLAFDNHSQKIYFSDIVQGNIKSVNFDGTDFRTVVGGKCFGTDSCCQKTKPLYTLLCLL